MAYALILHILFGGLPAMILGNARTGAMKRLARPECQEIFTEFRDREGVSLAARLEALGETPMQHLSRLYFADANRSETCATDLSNVLFTAPGNYVVYVCTARFADRFARHTAAAEILIVHELLHTLGLGEDPPTSEQITDRVRVRCGR